MKLHVLFFFLISGWSIAVFPQQNPVANPASTIVWGNARFTVLTPEMIRMEYSQSGKFEDKASLVFINRNLPVPKFTKREKGKEIILKTDKLLLKYTNDGNPFHAENLFVRIEGSKHKKILWTPGTKDTLNLKGTLRTLDHARGWDYEKHLEQGILSRSGWALVDDSKTNLFDGSVDWNWVTQRTDSTAIDWYLFAYGNDYKKALNDYTKVAGKIPLPPKFAFGYWWSRYWTYNDNEFRELIKDIKGFGIPIDVLVIDMDWHYTYGLNERDPMGELKGWTGYTWNKDLFPEPQKFMAWTNKQHLKTALNLHPASGISNMEKHYEEFAGVYGFDTSKKEYIPFNMSDKKWAKTYFDVILKPMEEWGVDFWWLDWQQYLEDKNFKNLSNTWWLNYTFFTNMEKKEQRPLLFHRWGGMGNHRYQVGFSGDTYSSWESLDFLPYFTSTASNVGYGYWSHDIGGHFSNNGPTDGELYLRWIQYGVFSPILRTHSSKISEIERRFWMFPQYFHDMRGAIKLRYTLAPYIYHTAFQAYKTGISVCRPMYYDYPEKEKAYTYKGQYMFGDDILVSPVTTPLSKLNWLASKKIWLPEGDWFEYHSGTLLQGNREVERFYSQEEIPFFIKAGSIIHMNPEVKNLQEKPAVQVISFIPGTSRAKTELYGDDEATNEYQKGSFSTRTVIRENTSDRTMKITINPATGYYNGMPQKQAFELKLLNSTLPQAVIINGKTVKANYLSRELTVSVEIPEMPVTEKIDIEMIFDTSFADQLKIFNGNKGFLKRVVQATEKLKFEVASKNMIGTLPDPVYEVGNITNRIFYYPEKTYTLMERLNTLKSSMAGVLLSIPTLPPESVRPVIEYLELNNLNDK
ncbi:glycoside hydrolase family 31 protein [Abyssalbus ytuae]|uniref:Glycoside hydrolase family 31 protein n=1 Tax=Abyssalbus ytuae TaxID=2926907 RepID=A0A9E6ZPE6_9FLAO|nr:TIM-barrel domain-containing protein [Abyssalbus ytuae]UOB18454.1 glycoside hydrolase family 31 protein [Abyssalbus ytuae]